MKGINMTKRIKKSFPVIVLVVSTLLFYAQAADSEVFASKTFVATQANLISSSSTLYLDFYVRTNTSNSQLGISRIDLYDVTTGSSAAYAGPKKAGISYDDQIALPATKGHRYYANVTFYADGYTKQVKTNTLTF